MNVFAGRRNKARLLRTTANTARDERRWKDASILYGDYLALNPHDAHIHVQHGHSLKEAGDADGAAQAYTAACRLLPDDSELWLHAGHLEKLRGNYPAAAQCFERAVDLDPRSTAYGEMLVAPIREYLSSRALASLALAAKDALGAVATRSHGLLPLSFGNIGVVDQDLLALQSDDPWIIYRIDGGFPDDLQACVIRLDMKLASGREPRPRLYFDIGNGFGEATSITPWQDANGDFLFFLLRPSLIRQIRVDFDEAAGQIRLTSVSVQPLPDVVALTGLLAGCCRPGEDRSESVSKDILHAAADILNETSFAEDRIVHHIVALSPTRATSDFEYRGWLSRYVDVRAEDLPRLAALNQQLTLRPRFSFVMPVYNPPVHLLRLCIDSMLSQRYENFEICIADDCSTDPEIRTLLKSYTDPRVKIAFRNRNGHISAASNSALALATGDFIVLVDHDDLVPDYALLVVAYYASVHPQAAIFFSDEDKIDLYGRRSDPYFKTRFNRFLMFGHNMVSHLGVYRRDLVDAIGGFRLGFEGSQDYDLFLRAYERCNPENIIHIPHVLYHWRMLPGSTSVSADQKSYAIIAAQAAINGYFERNAIPFRSVDGFAPGNTAIRATREFHTAISIIIPTRNGLGLLKPCIESIMEGDLTDVELIVVDNGSDDSETLEYLSELALKGTARILEWKLPFNYSDINNFAAREAHGEIILFLNNDTEVLNPAWINRARALLSMPEIGIVGARLLYPDNTLQHFGVVTGTGEHGVATTPHAGIPAAEAGYFSKAQMIQEFSAVTAACMFVRKADFEAIGGFDPALQVAYNDVDLCLRFRAVGFAIVCDPDILLIHKESRTRGSDRDGENAARLAREAERMHERWGSALRDPFWSPNLSDREMHFTLAYPPRVPMPWRQAD